MSVQTESLRFILGLKLRALRRQRGDSLQAVAGRSGLSVSYLSEIEKGKKYPKPDKLVSLAEALGVSYDNLVSLSVSDNLDPLKDVFSSSFIREFPFELFGMEPNDVFALVSDQPERSTALIRAFLQVARTYDIQVEHFLFAALRSYQEMHGNYFEELETEAASFRSNQNWSAGATPSHDTLRELLTSTHNYTIDLDTLADHPELHELRSVFVEGTSPTLFVNSNLMPKQRAFVYARELGYCVLDVDERATTSSWLKVESFEQLLNNFEASDSAGAVLLDRASLLDDLETLFGAASWNPDAFRTCLAHYQATPEMMAYRITQLIPHHFGLDDFFFLRFYHRPPSSDFQLSKLLNMSEVAVPHGIGLDEHYCHRWPAIQLLKTMGEAQRSGSLTTDPSAPPQIRAQRSHFLNADAEYFVLSTARPLALSNTNSCVSVGFLMDDAFRKRIHCWQDEAIPQTTVNLTCERCPLTPEECTVRVAPSTIHASRKKHERRVSALEALRATAGDT